MGLLCNGKFIAHNVKTKRIELEHSRQTNHLAPGGRIEYTLIRLYSVDNLFAYLLKYTIFQN